MGHVQIDLILPKDPHFFVHALGKDLTGSDIAWDQVTVLGVFLL